ncbi:hypothetical protein [Methanolobus psychrotolerans]|uniref:hypothetical protein n=1 Tax=Methanolobus psychrotolerans TaxID=1874706 RepID=UPI0013ED093A|nr:hypothetical protein [Methanolobus psychrotolerans]
MMERTTCHRYVYAIIKPTKEHAPDLTRPTSGPLDKRHKSPGIDRAASQNNPLFFQKNFFSQPLSNSSKTPG